MSLIELEGVDPLESHGSELEAAPPIISSSSGESAHAMANSSPFEELLLDRNPWSLFEKAALECKHIMIPNFKAFLSRLVRLCFRPEDLASVILDIWSSLRSIVWSERRPGLDLLYPFSSTKKFKSGPLAWLLLEHCRDQHAGNLHDASSSRVGIDPPRVAVMDLGEVSPEIIERGYSMSADFHGFAATVLLLEILISIALHIVWPTDFVSHQESMTAFFISLYGDWLGSWFAFVFIRGPLFGIAMYTIPLIFSLCLYATLRGDGTLDIVWRSDRSPTGCAVLLDVNFTLILKGDPNLVDAIAESTVSISHPLARKYQVIGWQIGQHVAYGALRCLCKGALIAIPTGVYLLLVPKLSMPVVLLMTLVTLLTIATELVGLSRMVTRVPLSNYSAISIATHWQALTVGLKLLFKFLLVVMPPLFLVSSHTSRRTIIKDPLFRDVFYNMMFLHLIPWALLIIHLFSIPNYRIRTTKLLEILGNPPIRRWEFDTLAAAVTFQSLVVCHSIARPVDSANVLSLMDVFLPDERDIWRVWKARVADRVTHQVDISFAPTIPSFRDHQQQRLKELLDQAQIGHDVYRRFYDGHVSQQSLDHNVL